MEMERTHRHYIVYGYRVCSNMPLPELPPATFQERDLEFRHLPMNGSTGLLSESARLLTRRSTNLGCDLSVFESENGLLLRWEDNCDFQVSKDGRDILCQPLSNVGPIWIQSTLYGMVLSFALHIRGVSNLHGSAVALPEGVIGFLAEPGNGKSTLASAFAADGFPFVTDDVLAMSEVDGEILALPGFPFVSLAANSLEEIVGRDSNLRIPLNGKKSRIFVDGTWVSFQSQRAPLKALFLLNRSDQVKQVEIVSLGAPLAIQHLLSDTNCLPILPKDVLARHMAFLSRLVARVPVYRLTFPTGYERIPQVREAVLRHQKTFASKAPSG